MQKKYELTDEVKEYCGRQLHRVKALQSFGSVSAGDVGGWIEKEDNLSQLGDAWVYDNAEAFGNAWVRDNARVYGNAKVFGNALVYGNAKVFGNAWVRDNARVYDNAEVCGKAVVRDNAEVCGKAVVCGNAVVCGDAEVRDNARVRGNAEVYGNAKVRDNAEVYGNADYAVIRGFGTCYRSTTFFRCADGSIKVACGCFLGTIDEFRKQVKATRKGKIAKEYLMIADLMEYHFTDTIALGNEEQGVIQ